MCAFHQWSIQRYVIFGLLCVLSTTMAKEVNSIVRANNKFGLDLFKVLSRDEGNLLISPFSAHVVLSMAYQGAAGDTAESMAKVFHLSNPETTADEYFKIIGHLNRIEHVTLNVANKVYIMKDFKLLPDFKSVLENKFLSEGEEINFAENVNAAKNINSWVEDKTNHKIKELIKSTMLDSLTRLVLVNAVYFKGNWAKKFSPASTEKKPFYLLSGEEISVDMMFQKDKFKYNEDSVLNCKILEMPYEGHELSMVIFLPNERNGITQLQEKLVDADLTDILQQMSQNTVIVELPKFTIESTIPMSDALKEMGAANMFTDSANFSKMCVEGVKVSDVIQKTFIEVNEEGAEAAAATGMIMMTRCMPMPMRESTFKVDHPFIFALIHKAAGSNTVLFYGHLLNFN